jgi:hypothetical protein
MNTKIGLCLLMASMSLYGEGGRSKFIIVSEDGSSDIDSLYAEPVERDDFCDVIRGKIGKRRFSLEERDLSHKKLSKRALRKARDLREQELREIDSSDELAITPPRNLFVSLLSALNASSHTSAGRTLSSPSVQEIAERYAHCGSLNQADDE